MKGLIRKLAASVAAIITAGAVAWAANVPLTTGIFEPNQLAAIINALTQNINTNAPGVVASLTSNFAAIATTAEQTLFTTTIASNQLTQAGQSLHLRCSGYSATNGDTKSAKLYFGTGATVSTGNFTTAGANWDLDLVVTYNASASSFNYIGRTFAALSTTGAGVVNVNQVASTDTTDNIATGVTAKCTGTQGTSTIGDITGVQMTVEQMK